MSVLSDLVTAAFQDIGEIPVGRTPATLELAQGLTRTNNILGMLANSPLTVFNMYHVSGVTIAATRDYTIGPSGTFVGPTIRPMRVQGALSVAGAQSNPVRVVSFEEFDQRAVNGIGRTSILAEMIAVDQAVTNVNMRIFPTPIGVATLWLDYWAPTAPFAAVGDTITWPPGHELMVQKLLAVDLFTNYGTRAQPGTWDRIVAEADQAKRAVMELNAAILGIGKASQQAG